MEEEFRNSAEEIQQSEQRERFLLCLAAKRGARKRERKEGAFLPQTTQYHLLSAQPQQGWKPPGGETWSRMEGRKAQERINTKSEFLAAPGDSDIFCDNRG